jgi:hypothetical protein
MEGSRVTFTAAEVEAAAEAYYDEEGVQFWNEIRYGDNVELTGIGPAEHVDSHGGEGEGDSAWVVFKVGDQLFRKDGYYASYDGFDWSVYSGLTEVEAYEKTVIAYKEKK